MIRNDNLIWNWYPRLFVISIINNRKSKESSNFPGYFKFRVDQIFRVEKEPKVAQKKRGVLSF